MTSRDFVYLLKYLLQLPKDSALSYELHSLVKNILSLVRIDKVNHNDANQKVQKLLNYVYGKPLDSEEVQMFILDDSNGKNMAWNYRILRDKHGLYKLCEVYYDKGNVPFARSAEPRKLCGYECAEDLIADLVYMLNDARGHKAIDDPWPDESNDFLADAFSINPLDCEDL